MTLVFTTQTPSFFPLSSFFNSRGTDCHHTLVFILPDFRCETGLRECKDVLVNFNMSSKRRDRVRTQESSAKGTNGDEREDVDTTTSPKTNDVGSPHFQQQQQSLISLSISSNHILTEEAPPSISDYYTFDIDKTRRWIWRKASTSWECRGEGIRSIIK